MDLLFSALDHMSTGFHIGWSEGVAAVQRVVGWTEADIAFFLSLLARGKNVDEIAHELQRPPAEILSVARRFSVKVRTAD